MEGNISEAEQAVISGLFVGVDFLGHLAYVYCASDTVNLQAVADTVRDRAEAFADGRALCRGIGVPTSRNGRLRLPVMLFIADDSVLLG